MRATLADVVAELRDEIAQRKLWASRRGRDLTARQEVGRRCEETLRAAGVPGEWLVRAHRDHDRAIVAMGSYAPPWTEGKVQELLRPVLAGYRLVCKERPLPQRER